MKYKAKKGKIIQINSNLKEIVETLITIKGLEQKGIIKNINGLWYLTEKGKNLK